MQADICSAINKLIESAEYGATCYCMELGVCFNQICHVPHSYTCLNKTKIYGPWSWLLEQINWLIYHTCHKSLVVRHPHSNPHSNQLLYNQSLYWTLELIILIYLHDYHKYLPLIVKDVHSYTWTTVESLRIHWRYNFHGHWIYTKLSALLPAIYTTT